jgi:uncharacterized membrane protein
MPRPYADLTEREYDELLRKAAAHDADEADVKRIIKWCMYILVGVIIGFSAVIIVWRLINPQLNLYKANTEKQSTIAVSKAKRDAAVFEKEAAITRAEGVAEANKIIANSITEEYIRWLYVDQLDTIEGQIIYIPTEAGIPILEATRDSAVAGG